jgi:peptide/nickel transport system substrate-binding protein
MFNSLARPLLMMLVGVFAAACAPGAPPAAEPPAAPEVAPAEPARSLVVAVRVEPLTIAMRPLREQGVNVDFSRRMFNAQLATLDERAVPQPYLVEALPRLNTTSWRVFSDGRMETTYRLKPDLTWHDGKPLSAEDFVFSWQVYVTPEFSAGGRPTNLIEEIQAPDPRTLVIRWRQPYPDAESLTDRDAELPPLPRHILEPAFQAAPGAPDVFAHHPYWTSEYVGLGPYRLERWEPGAFIEGVAFDRHVLGRPKIPRIKIIFISDQNTAMANLLAGEVTMAADSSLAPLQAPTLRREWAPDKGTVLGHPRLWRAAYFQFRPELASPRALQDPRVRKALAHVVDKLAINEAVYDGEGTPADSLIPPVGEAGLAVNRAITKYPYDPRRTEQLMAEAGFRKGADGAYASPSEGPLTAELKTNAAADQEAEMTVLASGWRQLGFDIRDSVLPVALARDNQVRASFPGMFAFSSGVSGAVFNQTSARIPRPENRWLGGNRGGWSNPEYDRLAEAYGTTLDREERSRLLVDISRLYADEFPTIPLFFRSEVYAFVAALRGPRAVPPETYMAWDIQTWDLR